jgi:hypothetical protein
VGWRRGDRFDARESVGDNVVLSRNVSHVGGELSDVVKVIELPRWILLSYWRVAQAGFCSGVSSRNQRCQSCDESIALCEVATVHVCTIHILGLFSLNTFYYKKVGNWNTVLKCGIRFLARPRNVSLFHSIQTRSGAYSVSYSMCTGGCFPRGLKHQSREADHSPPTTAEVKNTWI